MTASPFGALTVIANPNAGQGRVGRELAALERGLTARGLDYSLQVTDGPGDATRLATEAMDGGARFLVAVGGDGTIQEVVNGMFRDGHTIGESCRRIRAATSFGASGSPAMSTGPADTYWVTLPTRST